jgi:imidazoleglycerol-phosphate dehydratase
MRRGNIERKTAETDVALQLTIDGSGQYDIETNCGFLDHMLELFARHGRFDLTLRCKGDTQVDMHHTVEDIAICLGAAFDEALGDRKGIRRYGSCVLPMDEALILAALDISGRAYLNYRLYLPAAKVGDFDTELAKEFFAALSRSMKATMHIKQLEGENTHHIIEGAFKAVARALKTAASIDADYADEIPSTKGKID